MTKPKGCVTGGKVHLHNYAEPVQVWINQSTGEFLANVGGVDYTAETRTELVDVLNKGIVANLKIEWFAVLEVKVSTFEKDEANQPETGELQLDIGREWYARSPKDKRYWLVAGWDDYDEDGDRRLLQSKTSYDRDRPLLRKNTDYYGSTTYTLAYSDELWAGLLEVITQLRVLRDRLNTLIGSKAGQEQLRTVGENMLGRLLAAPKEE